MRFIPVAFTVFTCAAAFAASSAADDATPDPREKLESAIPEMIRLLETKEYTTLLKNYAPPEVLKAITGKTSLEEVAKEFGEGKAEKLLTVLKSIKEMKPTLDADGKKATYEGLKGEKSKIVFLKIDKYWYIGN